jgi:hypothetical protein
MNIENFRLSNLTETQVTYYINEGKCVVIECHVRNGTNLVNIKHHIGVRLCGTFTRGKCIEYDGLPTIPINDIKEYEAFFLCKTYNANNLAKELINHYSKK